MLRERGLIYWLSVISGAVALAGILASGSVRLSDNERKTQKIPGIEWDLLLVKAMLAAISPAKYDSVLSNQVRIYGQRPERQNP